MKKEYSSPSSFRMALLTRIKIIAKNEGVSVQRLQKQVAFDRLLCRLFSGKEIPWVLKGGHALELRIQKSRATKDIDLALKEIKIFNAAAGKEQNKLIFEKLQEKASLNLKDFFEYTIGLPVLDLDAAPYGGGRFPVETIIDGKIFIKFHLDIGVGDVWIEPHEEIELRDWLEFAGMGTKKIPLISVEQHFAEKLHAYTLPRKEGIINSRVKDLIDLVLLIQEKKTKTNLLQIAIYKTFKRRSTHKVPIEILPPPKEWEAPFAVLAEQCDLNLSVTEAYKKLYAYWKKMELPSV